MSRDLMNEAGREEELAGETAADPVDVVVDRSDGSTGLRSVLATDFNVWQAIGGVRGLTETALPSLIFIVAFVSTENLLVAVLAPLGIAALAIVVRLVQRIDVMPALGAWWELRSPRSGLGGPVRRAIISPWASTPTPPIWQCCWFLSWCGGPRSVCSSVSCVGTPRVGAPTPTSA